MESIDRYLRETARGHTDKGVSLTRVLVSADAALPKPVLGYFTLAPCMVEAAGWPEVPKGLPRNPVGAILLGRIVSLSFDSSISASFFVACPAVPISTRPLFRPSAKPIARR